VGGKGCPAGSQLLLISLYFPSAFFLFLSKVVNNQHSSLQEVICLSNDKCDGHFVVVPVRAAIRLMQQTAALHKHTERYNALCFHQQHCYLNNSVAEL